MDSTYIVKKQQLVITLRWTNWNGEAVLKYIFDTSVLQFLIQFRIYQTDYLQWANIVQVIGQALNLTGLTENQGKVLKGFRHDTTLLFSEIVCVMTTAKT